MFLSVLIALQQMPAGAPVGQPVRVTLEPSTIAPGDAVHAFVEVATAGHLIVLRVTADGRAEVVFPADPSEGTFVSAGSYEIQPPGRTSAFTANERAGGGLVLAALALVPYEFGEFVRGGGWDAVALASGTGSDATGRLLDVVQRMLGPEYFHYDAAPYTVAPYTTSESDVIGAAYGGFGYGGYAPCYGYGCYGFTPWADRPCLSGRFGCGYQPAICDPFTGLWDCGPAAAFCRGGADGVLCRRPSAVARYRRGELLGEVASTQPTHSLSAVLNQSGRRKPSAETSIPSTGASRSTPLATGRKPAASSATRAAAFGAPKRTAAGVGGARPTEGRLPQRVPWPGQVLARGTKTAAPAVSPREARLKQSASRPPLPARVPWPTGVAARATKPAAGAAGAAGAASAPGLATATPRGAVPAFAVPRTKDASAVARGGAASGAAGSARSLAPSAPARTASPAAGSSRAFGGARATASAGKGSSGGARASAPARAAPSGGGARAGGGGGSGKH